MKAHQGEMSPVSQVLRVGSVLLAIALAGCSGGGGAGSGVVPQSASSTGGGISTASSVASVVDQGLEANSVTTQNFGTYASVVQADQPAAYFRLDETSGQPAHDLMHSGTTGPYSGSITQSNAGLISGDTDTSALFEGGNIVVKGDTLVQPTQAITLEAWIKPDNSSAVASGVKILSDSEPWAAPYDAYVLGLSMGMPTVKFIIGGQAVQVTSSSSLAALSTHHLVASYDGSSVRLWVDGQLAASKAASGSIGNYTADGFAIGADTKGNYAFRGVIDEVAVYPKALSLNRIIVHEAAAKTGSAYDAAVLGNSPVAYYRLNEMARPTAYDASATNQSATYGAGAYLGFPGAFGTQYTATNFINDIVNIPRNTVQFPTQAVSVEAIIQPVATDISSSGVKIVSAGTPWAAPYSSYLLALNSGKPTMTIGTNAGALSISAPSALTAGSLYHLVGTYDGSTLSIYANGTLLNSVAATGGIYLGSGSGIAIGGDVTSNWLYHGLVGDVAVYPTALPASVVAAHAALVPNLGNPGTVVSTVAPLVSTVVSSSGNVVNILPMGLSTGAVNLLSLSQSATIAISEAGASNGYSIKTNSCANIANVSLSSANVQVVPLSAGTCSVTVGDGNGQTASFSVTVTLTSVQGQ